MEILVTGGAGYLGSALVPLLLSKGHRVRVLDNLSAGGRSMLGFWSDPAFRFHQGDVTNAGDVRTALEGADAVVHLAAIVGDPACARNKPLATAVNLEGSLALLSEAKRSGVRRFVFASTCSNYGRVPADEFATESAALQPLSLYAESKVAMEKAILEQKVGGNDMAATALRFSTLFGVAPRMRFDLTVNEFAMEMVANKALKVFGEQFWRPYVHVRDAARAIELVLAAPVEKVGAEVFNVGSNEQQFTKKMLVDLIQPLATDAKVEYVRKQEDPRDYRVNFDKIARVLNFRISRTVPEGVREVVDLVRAGLIKDFTEPGFRN
jgi:nucleoside-diphosphate-sugar epimerase